MEIARPAERARRLRRCAELASDPARSYATSHRQAQVAAGEQLPATVAACQRAYQLLRRHGQVICRRKDPSCSSCPISGDCLSVGQPPPLY